MEISLLQILVLALIQGAAELLPVSSSAHVIVVEKLMGLDPSSPQMTFLLVMLHTGTMFAVIAYFWKRWAALITQNGLALLKTLITATVLTGILGFGLKKIIEKGFLAEHGTKAEIEMLFSNLTLIACSLFAVGIFITVAGIFEKRRGSAIGNAVSQKQAGLIGLVQGLCLPFRGFSRSGATISTGLLTGVSREMSENFSFALAVILTPPVILLELKRLVKSSGGFHTLTQEGLGHLLAPGFLGMGLSAVSGFLALKWLSAWLENGRWSYFGAYCVVASTVVFGLAFAGF